MVAVEEFTVESNGLKMKVAAAGPKDAPVLLCLHGFPEGWMSWRPVMERLGDRYRIYAPDLRGYGDTEKPEHGYDVLTLTDDIRGLFDALELNAPMLVGHDWGGALAWIYAHRYGRTLSQLVVVNCTHPKTLFRGILERKDGQHLKSWYAGAFQIPWLPERLASANNGAVLRRAVMGMEGRPGALNQALVDELLARFKTPKDLHGPINYYRELGRMQVSLEGRQALAAIYGQPITCPVTMVWGDQDHALSMAVAQESHREAGQTVEWVTLKGVGHFVSMEDPNSLAQELQAVADRNFASHWAPPQESPAE